MRLVEPVPAGRHCKMSRARRQVPMNRFLVTVGTILIVAGLLWRWLKKIPLFHLPGDIVVDRPGFKLFFPITTMLIVSAMISLVAWLMKR
jgi:hypothetical protein